MSNLKNNWLKLKVDFFNGLKLKKLRKIAGGDTYLIIYQKLMLLTINTEGHYLYENIEPTIEEELAIVISEEVDNIKMTILFLKNVKLLEYVDNNIFLVDVPKLLGKYDDSSERVAKYREREKLKHSCNALQSLHVTNVTLLDIEKDKDIDIDKDIDKEKSRERSRAKALVIFDFTNFNEKESEAIKNWISEKKVKTQIRLDALRRDLLRLRDIESQDLCSAIDHSMPYKNVFPVPNSNKYKQEIKKSSFNDIQKFDPNNNDLDKPAQFGSWDD